MRRCSSKTKVTTVTITHPVQESYPEGDEFLLAQFFLKVVHCVTNHNQMGSCGDGSLRENENMGDLCEISISLEMHTLSDSS